MKRTQKPKTHAVALRELQTIPGIGPSIAQDLVDLGITKVSDLKGRDPEILYRRFEKLVGTHVDRCLLYTFRCAVYYASNDRHKPRLLKWWNWMDRAR
jgi:nucleotidyltransferase/DNA polymerase involved in DNA repair